MSALCLLVVQFEGGANQKLSLTVITYILFFFPKHIHVYLDFVLTRIWIISLIHG